MLDSFSHGARASGRTTRRQPAACAAPAALERANEQRSIGRAQPRPIPELLELRSIRRGKVDAIVDHPPFKGEARAILPPPHLESPPSPRTSPSGPCRPPASAYETPSLERLSPPPDAPVFGARQDPTRDRGLFAQVHGVFEAPGSPPCGFSGISELSSVARRYRGEELRCLRRSGSQTQATQAIAKLSSQVRTIRSGCPITSEKATESTSVTKRATNPRRNTERRLMPRSLLAERITGSSIVPIRRTSSMVGGAGEVPARPRSRPIRPALQLRLIALS
jgi:hypothetical protein